jgi:hypothetical protein
MSRNAYKVLVQKMEGKRPFRRWEDLKEVGCKGVDWIQLVQYRVRWHIYELGNVPSDSVEDREFLELSDYHL